MKKKIKRLLSLFMVITMLAGSLTNVAAAVAGKVSENGSSNDFPIVAGSTAATIWVDSNEEAPVQRVVKDFQADVKRVTGKTPTISKSTSLPSGPVVLIGTLNKSNLIKNLISSGKITIAEVNAIKGKWEAYLIKVIDKNTMVIVGSDNRGAIFGTYEVSEQMGVSPWYYFADVPIQTKTNVYMPSGTSLTDKPDVQYRGIFINDEEKLNSWVVNKFNPENNGSGKMGAAIYAKIFELILRLKGNYIWPAMHVNAFDNISENIDTIREYGVVMRKTVSAGDEWGTFKTKYAKAQGISASTLSYDYTVNPEAIRAFWRDSITRHKDTEAQWLFGMRGTGDEPFNTANLSNSKWDKYGTNTQDRKAGLLSEIIADQITVMQEVLGKDKTSKVCKAILPYKEVLQLYNNSKFTLPSDMNVIWCDDNHGMVRSTPTASERARSGGGIYYHASYWAPADQSYLWMSSIPLSVMGEELNKCWKTNIRQIWVLNVGDIKPAEGEMDYFIRCGWDVDKYTNDSVGFSKEWLKRNFGNSMSDSTVNEVADILNTFYHHTNVRKVEHMKLGIFEQMNYNEWEKRMSVYQDLYNRARTVANSLSSSAKTAFYELVQCKMNWTYLTYKMFYYADKSNLAYKQGRMASAQNFSDLSIKVEKQRKTEIAYYSEIANGKWKGLIDPENYSPPVTTQLPGTNPTLELGKAEMGVIVQGENMPKNKKSDLHFTQYNQDGKFIDIFNKGAGSVSWTATSDQSWVKLSATSGTFNEEQRVWVTISDYAKAAGKTATVTITSGDKAKRVKITVDAVTSGISNCYVESDGYVSMQAEHYTTKSAAGEKSWTVRYNAGRGFDGDMMQAYDTQLGLVDENNINSSTSPSLSYDFYLTSSGAFPLEVYRLPTMNAVPNGKIRFAVSVDGQNPIVISSTATDEGTTSNQNPQWKQNLYRQIEKHVVTLPNLSAGKHTLKLWMVDNFITIDKLVIYTNGSVTESALGPDESYHSKYNTTFTDSVSSMPRTSAKLDEKDIMSTWGSGAFLESGGKVSIEAEYAMENVLDSKEQLTSDMYAYTISKKAKASEVSGRVENEWRLTQSDTGLAMRLPDKGSGWSDSQFVNYSPELGYRIKFNTAGTYNVWLRWRYVDNASDSIRGGIDNKLVSGEFTGGGGFHSDSKDEKWYWQKVAAVNVSSTGQHSFVLWEREDGLHVDKIYLTTGTETPTDDNWKVSSREGTAAKVSLQQTVATKAAEADNVSYPLGTSFGCYSKTAYHTYIQAIEEAKKLAQGGNVTEATANKAITAIDTAKQALKDSQVLTKYTETYNAYRDFEDDEIGKYPFGFDAEELTNGAEATIQQENGNKYLRVTTGTTSGKANIFLPFTGDVSPNADERAIIEFKARFTGTFQYANAAMIRNDTDKYAMVAAFENANQVKEIRVQNGSSKIKVQNFNSGQWYSFKMVGNCNGKTYSVYIDDVLVATDYTFRDSSGTKLTGQLFGISGFANGRVDFDDFSTKVESANKGTISSELTDKVSARKNTIQKYSYPLGDTVGCYSKDAYNKLVSEVAAAETLASSGTVTEKQAEAALKAIDDAHKALDNSLKLTVGKTTYNAYRDFENDTTGALLPYGIDATRIDNGGAASIVEENGNKFLRLSTDSASGHVNMFLPYVGDVIAKCDEKIIVEFSARFNEELRYANAFIAKNQLDAGATTIAFDNTNQEHKVILKKSASSSVKAADFTYDTWNNYKVVVDMEDQVYTVYMNNKVIAENYPFRTTGSVALFGHVFGIDGFTNGKLDFDNFKVSVVDEDDTSTITGSDGIAINGYQINTVSKGMRTVYSVGSKINGKDVVNSGIVYSLSKYVSETELYVGSENQYVQSFESTSVGKLDTPYSQSDNTTSYAMTMKFATKNPDEYNAGWRIRAYAKLSDGEYVYSDTYEYTIYGIADRLYRNGMMTTKARHDYLYTDILSVVDSQYKEIEFNWNHAVAGVK